MITILRQALRRIRRALTRTEPLITVSISKENLLHNLRAYRTAYPGLAIAPVLKSNAYGHGAAVIAELLDHEDIAFFMVDSLYEARKMRRAGIRSRLVVMGYVRPEAIATSTLRDTQYAVVDIEQLRELARTARMPVRIHIKVDTGMHRNGLLPSELPEAIELVRSSAYLKVVGVATHLADADNPDPAFSYGQLSVWKDAVQVLKEAFPDIEYWHASATKGVRFSADVPMNLARVGIGLYGCDTSPYHTLPLKPVLEMRSSITALREIPAGDAVGYNATFRAQRTSRIATVSAGYFEGIDRGLSSKGAFLVRGRACPIAGRVSMNMTSIDVTDLPEARRGDAVILISRDPEDPNSILSMAQQAQTSPYVLLAHIPGHLLRVVE